MASIVAGVVEEASFRGYMQGPIERRHGPVVAILVTGSVFGFAHFTHPEVTLILMPYYLAVAAIYGAAGLPDELDPAEHGASRGRERSGLSSTCWRGAARSGKHRIQPRAARSGKPAPTRRSGSWPPQPSSLGLRRCGRIWPSRVSREQRRDDPRTAVSGFSRTAPRRSTQTREPADAAADRHHGSTATVRGVDSSDSTTFAT